MRSTRVIKGVTGPETQKYLRKFLNISGFYLDSIFHPRSRHSDLQLIIFHFILWNKNILEFFTINLRKNCFYIIGRKFLNRRCLLLLIQT